MDRDAMPAPDPFDIERAQHERAAGWLGDDYGSPAGAAKELSGAGERGHGDRSHVPASAVAMPRRSLLRRWLAGRGPEPSDAQRLISRYRREYGIGP